MFAKYHSLLFANQPAEGTAGPDDDQLIEWAVEAGADEDAVRQPIEDKVYEQWIENATDQMSQGRRQRHAGRLHRRPDAARPGHRGERRAAGDRVTGHGVVSGTLTDLHRASHLPKAELHVHHVGSASARIVSELAERHPGVVPSDLDELEAFFAFRDFAHFVEVYLAVVGLIRTADDIRYLTYEVAREMAEGQRIRYAELTCTPYTSVLAGIPIEAYTEAIEDARVAAERDFGLVLRWIYDIPGESGLPAADATLSLRARPPRRRARRVRARRARDRRAAGAVPAALRGGPGGRPAQRAARRRDHRPRDHLGLAAAARRGADRPRHLGSPGSRRCWTTWPRPGSRSRSARRPTWRPAPSPRSPSTRCGPSSTRASP